MSTVSQLCAKCAGLGLTRDDFDSVPFLPGKYHKVILSGTIGELRLKESQCFLCRLLLNALSRNLAQQPDVLGQWDREWEAKWYRNTAEYDPATKDAKDMYGSALYPRLKDEHSPMNHGIQLVIPPGESKFLRAREVSPTLNIEFIKTSISRCHTQHGISCVATSLSVTEHPFSAPGFRVIDTTRKCLETLPQAHDYVALSYVWGKTNIPSLSKANLRIFHEDGVFDRIKLARTIRDAVDLTAKLGFRFLWVDAICIVQDDHDVKEELIANMAVIYGNAALTIVAASGTHADAGLLVGSQQNRAARAVVTEKFGKGLTLGVFPHLDYELMGSTYGQRGWTYQESCLSPRCLILWDGLAYFMYRAAVWREDMDVVSDCVQPFYSANTMGKTTSEWPLRRFANHVNAYTSRNLTYQSDTLRAFNGIQTALAASMGNTEMLFGLPVAALDWALLWRGAPNSTLKRRRGFPSWSWAGWCGSIIMAQDHFSEFDQKWLRERTWHQWHLGRLVEDFVGAMFEFVRLQDKESNSSTPDRGTTLDDASDVTNDTFMPRYGPALTTPRWPALEVSVSPEYRPKSKHAGKHTNATALCFRASIFDFRIKFGNDDDSRPAADLILQEGSKVRPFSILDDDGCVCGGGWDHSGQLDRLAIVVPMSWAGPSSVSANISSRDELKLEELYLQTTQNDSKDGEEVMGEWHEWEFLNVMIVEDTSGESSSHEFVSSLGFVPFGTSTSTGICERRGVGVIHCMVDRLYYPRYCDVILL
ncbi:HET-domain-containing protein [Xylariaceae sp. AK1471]|nr:HET-domain-containing protein [Xylariaceae sp. AK1471]